MQIIPSEEYRRSGLKRPVFSLFQLNRDSRTRNAGSPVGRGALPVGSRLNGGLWTHAVESYQVVDVLRRSPQHGLVSLHDDRPLDRLGMIRHGAKALLWVEAFWYVEFRQFFFANHLFGGTSQFF